MKMKCICKENFEINEVLVGNKEDVLVVVDAMPIGNETAEDVLGYCDVINLTTNQVFEATWCEVEGNGALADVVWLG